MNAMKAIARLLKALHRIRLLSTFVALVFVFLLFTLITYHYMNGIIGDKRMVRMSANLRTEAFDVFERTSTRMARIQTYCNPFPSIALNEELYNISALIPELTLTKVYVVIRHGDRGPLRPVRNMSSISCDPFIALKSNVLQNLFKRFLIAVKDKLRTRKLSVNYALAPTTSVCHVGQLSRFGCVQHLSLGSQLGRFYGSILNIDSTNMKVLSTQYSRTFQSAVAFVYGFLKPQSVIDFQKFPPIVATFGTYFCQSSEFCLNKCKKLEVLHKLLNENKRQMLSSHPAVVRLLDNLKPIIANTMNESRLFESPVALFDGLMAYMCHNSGLPCDQKRCVTIEDVKQLNSFIEFHGKQLSVSNVFVHMNWLKIYGFLNHLIEIMSNIESKHKFMLYSGHDITIVALASALDFFDGILPPYASRVIFETYKDNTNAIYLRIIYNGKDVTRLTSICKLNSSKCLSFDTKHNIHLIKVKDFKEYVLKKFKSFTETNDYQNACNS